MLGEMEGSGRMRLGIELEAQEMERWSVVISKEP